MANITQIITIKRAWWVMPFIYCVRLFSGLTGMEVDYDKLAATVVRGLKPVFK
ncbi:hypothetical protein [Pseudomonas fluorescens]|uniref:Uncharacterized protein n=1 Tax=Pseudomonas fluorescens TaxID=294 RepID=A0A109KMT7_PSEFL|nr:hypothetical protein [Pseudomonas fluorescens]KWV72160.1 hypothetical protein PFL603g_04701 [Pseudomonas fluorescens]